jgi:hypothetical protein
MLHGVALVNVTVWPGAEPEIEQPPETAKVGVAPLVEVAVGTYVELTAGDVGPVEVIVTTGVASVKVWADATEVAAPYVESAAIDAVT